MKLPPVLYEAIQSTMGDHGNWHDARLPRTWISFERRAAWHVMRDNVLKQHPGLVCIDQPGAGQQFLEFHRMMMRHFRWLMEHTEGHGFELKPWNGVPEWLRASADNPFGFSESYLAAQQARTELLIETGTADELGNFLESTQLDTTFGSDVHNLCHGAVGAYEFAHEIEVSGAQMENLGTAHYNEHFWNLHAWLDEIYARWQISHDQVVDQSPLDPSDYHHHTDSGSPIAATHEEREHQPFGSPAEVPVEIS